MMKIKIASISALIGLIVGTVASLYGIVFEELNNIVFRCPSISIHIRLILVFILIFASYRLLDRVFSETSGSATNMFLRKYHLEYGEFFIKELLALGVASILTITAGGSVGPEGGGIFMGAALAALLARRLKLPLREIKALSIVGASAGIAATYRAPLTAVAFALEIPYIYDVEVHVLAEALIASLVSYAVAVYVLGFEPRVGVFQVGILPHHIAFETLLHAVLIGVISAVVTYFFIFSKNTLHKTSQTMYDSKYRDLIPIVLFISIVLTYHVSPNALGSGEEILRETFIGEGLLKETIMSLLILMIFKMLLTSVTFEFGGAGGIFIPSIFIGATVGTLYAKAIGATDPALYVVSGIAGVFAAANKTLLTAVFFTMESVGFGESVVAALTASTAYLLTITQTIHYNQLPERIGFEKSLMLSLYNEALRMNIRVDKEELRNIKAIPVKIVAKVNESIEEFFNRVLKERKMHRIYIVVDDEGKTLGYINFEELLLLPRMYFGAKIGDYMLKAETLNLNNTVKDAVELFLKTPTTCLIVVDDTLKPVKIVSPITISDYVFMRIMKKLYGEK